jgi:hypothetical protein
VSLPLDAEGATVADRVQEYYVVRVEGLAGGADPDRGRGRERFVEPQGGFGPISRAKRFRTAEAAERYIAERSDSQSYRFVVQLCARIRRGSHDDPLSQLVDRMMEIPQPYRRSAYNWLRGRDVRALLLRESEEVYERHRKVLLDHDIDISRPSRVVLMKRRRRGPIPINRGTPMGEDGPTQLIPNASQRVRGGEPPGRPG